MAVARKSVQVLRIGMLATVRNRRGIVTSAEPYSGADGVVSHFVTVEYLDADGNPEESLHWEREVGAHLLQPTALPDPTRHPEMLPDEFDALVRATRWGALTPFVDPDGSEGPLDRLPIVSPVHGAVQLEDFKLVPLIQALRMPRVSLLLADDVGLGKTVEAGLVLSELLNRRRIRRILVLSPASLCLQWQQEMASKFSLTFDLVNRDETHQLRKRMGMDANPWRTFSRVIASYYYLRQPDVLQHFLASSRRTTSERVILQSAPASVASRPACSPPQNSAPRACGRGRSSCPPQACGPVPRRRRAGDCRDVLVVLLPSPASFQVASAVRHTHPVMCSHDRVLHVRDELAAVLPARNSPPPPRQARIPARRQASMPADWWVRKPSRRWFPAVWWLWSGNPQLEQAERTLRRGALRGWQRPRIRGRRGSAAVCRRDCGRRRTAPLSARRQCRS